MSENEKDKRFSAEMHIEFVPERVPSFCFLVDQKEFNNLQQIPEEHLKSFYSMVFTLAEALDTEFFRRYPGEMGESANLNLSFDGFLASKGFGPDHSPLDALL